MIPDGAAVPNQIPYLSNFSASGVTTLIPEFQWDAWAGSGGAVMNGVLDAGETYMFQAGFHSDTDQGTNGETAFDSFSTVTEIEFTTANRSAVPNAPIVWLLAMGLAWLTQACATALSEFPQGRG